MKRVAIVQSNYIPWKGYFDLIDLSDEFILLDTQYTTRDWRNRNRIKTQNGVEWLTVPVLGSGWVSEVQIDGDRWARQHMKSLECAYGKAPYFKEYAPDIFEIYQLGATSLAELNESLIEHICGLFGINTPVTRSDLYESRAKSTQRLVDICRQSGATHYLTGPAAKSYLDESLFGDIQVEWMEYSYPEYPQLHGKFVHEVTILDLLFNAGPDINLMRTHADIRHRGIC